MCSHGGRILNTLAHLLATGADPELIATTAVSIWREVEQALVPVIGPRAVRALYGRSLSLTRGAYPCLATVKENEDGDDFATLRAALKQQTSIHAVDAQDALFQTFVQLLSRLIGGRLTRRLLESVLPSSAGDDVAEDIP